jgi:hypothetical protein
MSSRYLYTVPQHGSRIGSTTDRWYNHCPGTGTAGTITAQVQVQLVQSLPLTMVLVVPPVGICRVHLVPQAGICIWYLHQVLRDGPSGGMYLSDVRACHAAE